MALHKGALPGIIIASCALLFQCASGRSLQDSSCDFTTFSSLRSEWDSSDESCHKMLSFELWTLMKAEGSAQNTDAQYVRANCLQTKEVGLVELITPEGYTVSDTLEAAPGHVVSETEHATTYQGATAVTFEAFCEDENILKVSRVEAVLESRKSPLRKPRRRRLQATTSEAGQAHQVAELITGLQDLGCTRTTGEDQTVCVMSDTFNHLGNAAALQASGDLPQVEVVKEFPQTDEFTGTDEGSAMLELTFDIASGATYKFNTAAGGEQTYADDIGVLATEEGCDVIVDDVVYLAEPGFRDGAVADAVDAAVDSGSLYFSAAGNFGTGYKFTSDFECTTEFEGTLDGATEACGVGVSSHVFQPEREGIYRYFWRFDPAGSDPEEFFVKWDAAINTDQDVVIVIYMESLLTDEVLLWSINDNFSGGVAHEQALFTPLLDSFFVTYNLQIIQLGPEVWNADFLLLSDAGIGGPTDGSMFGHACASNCVAVAAMDWAEATGPGSAFDDPETGPVESYSSRGPCVVNGETRSKPTTCAADSLTTSSPGFEDFPGTSAAAPVAAAIATIVRAACFPKVVGYADIMEMMTNYDYTIDYTNDAGGAAETWGSEAGHGIISAGQMLAWVEANCGGACPGAASSPTTAPVDPPTPEPTTPTSEPTTGPAPASPTPTPVAVLETTEPTPSLVSPPTTTTVTTPAPITLDTPAPTAATSPPVEPPVAADDDTESSTSAPATTAAPTAPKGTPSPTASPVSPPTTTTVTTPAPITLDTPSPTAATPPPVEPPAAADDDNQGSTSPPATAAPSAPTGPPAPVSPPTTTTVTTPAPITPHTAPTAATPSPVEPPAPADDDETDDEEDDDVDDDSGYVEVGTKTTVHVTATAWDERPGQDSGGAGCGEDGCLPALAHDGVSESDIESRWSCSKDIVPGGGQCEIEFTFDSPQDIMDVQVDFWKGDERTRSLKVKLNGNKIGEFESHPGSTSTSLGIEQRGVHTVTLESVGIGANVWISLLEVRFMVEP